MKPMTTKITTKPMTTKITMIMKPKTTKTMKR
jgi:hypothetical protein